MATSHTVPASTFLNQRDRQPELMDQPGLNEAEHRNALRGIQRVNWISGGVPALWRELRSLARFGTPDRPLRVLDVACGGGDVVVRLAWHAQHDGLPIRFEGCDISETALQVARSAARSQPDFDLRFFRHDVLIAPFPEEYDVVMCSLFLHHLEETDAILLMRKMAMAARRAILIDDLLRTRLGYALCWVGCRILTRSQMVHTDGPLSVRAAFTVPELRDLAAGAGLQDIYLQKHWPQRFLLSWNRP